MGAPHARHDQNPEKSGQIATRRRRARRAGTVVAVLFEARVSQDREPRRRRVDENVSVAGLEMRV